MEKNTTPSQERHIPTYDAFGDPDEVRMELDSRLLGTMTPEEVILWWDTPNVHLELTGESPLVMLRTNPNAVIRHIYTKY